MSVQWCSKCGQQYALLVAYLCKKTLLEDTEATVEKQAPQTEPWKGYSQLVSWLVFEVHFRQGEQHFWIFFIFFFNLAEITGAPAERHSVLRTFGLVWICLSSVMPEMIFQNPYCGIYK